MSLSGPGRSKLVIAGVAAVAAFGFQGATGASVNSPPTADAGPNQTVGSGDLVTLDGSGTSDPDVGQILTYTWSQNSGTSVTLSDSHAVSPTFTAPTGPDTLHFTLGVCDPFQCDATPGGVDIFVE